MIPCPDCGTLTSNPRCADCARLRRAAALRTSALILLREADALDGQSSVVSTREPVVNVHAPVLSAWDRMEVCR